MQDRLTVAESWPFWRPVAKSGAKLGILLFSTFATESMNYLKVTYMRKYLKPEWVSEASRPLEPGDNIINSVGRCFQMGKASRFDMKMSDK